MDKEQAYYSLWSSFSVPAYDEGSVPDEAKPPYIAYQVLIDDIDAPVYPTATLWWRDTSWAGIDAKLAEIGSYIEDLSPIKLDDGYMNVTKGTPFAQRRTDDSDKTVKGYLLNLGVEFLTKY